MDGRRFPASLLSDVRRRLSIWWCERLFPGPLERTSDESWLIPILFLSFFAGILFFSRLGCPLLEPEEARYAEIPRQMLAEGRWLAPVLHGEDYYQKPPLLYWLIMVSYQVFGIHDWAARLVPSFAGMSVIFLTYGWARHMIGPRAALAGGVILCLSAGFLYLSSMVGMDGLLCLWVLGGLACGHLALARGDFRSQIADCTFAGQSAICNLKSKIHISWWLLSALCCGLGIMTKGPVAAVLVLGPLVLWKFLDHRGRRASRWQWFGYFAVVLLVAGPWYLAVSLRAPHALGTFFWLHNLVRYVAAFDHEKPAWFYVPSLALGMLPWSLLLIPLLPYLARRCPRWARRRPAGLGFFLLAFLWCLAFFSLSGCKRTAYILPAMPPLAVVLGTCLARAFPWNFRVKTALALSAGAAALLLVAASQLWLPSYHRHFALRGQVRRHADFARDVAVACFPKRWDSVSFYLGREVACFGPQEQDRLIKQLQDRETLLFVKNGKSLEDVLNALPPPWQFVPCGRQGWNVRVGVVKRKVPMT